MLHFSKFFTVNDEVLIESKGEYYATVSMNNTTAMQYSHGDRADAATKSIQMLIDDLNSLLTENEAT